MKNHMVALGSFILIGISLFAVVLFLIGDRHQAFNKHEMLYVEMATVTGIAPGSKVRAGGLDAGLVKTIEIPPHPSAKFRVGLEVDDKLQSMIREDSIVTVESDGLVGDKFLMIHGGTDQSPTAPRNFTLPSKEPIELSAILAKVSGTVDQASTTIGDVHVKLDGALDAVTATVHNTDGLVTDVRSGRGTVGMLLKDQQTAAQVKQVISNVQQASSNINQVSVQAQQLMADVQSRNLPSKLDDAMGNARDATLQLDQTSQKINTTVSEALAPDTSGTSAGESLRDTLSNVNLATANLADDTEALKHGFLFRGFFKKRGFYSLTELTPDEYRSNAYFQSSHNQRFWIEAADAFTADTAGAEVLSDAGKRVIDQIVGSVKDTIIKQPLIIEGYSNASDPAMQITQSAQRALLVEHYLMKRYRLRTTDIGLVSLNARPPQASGKNLWDGACIVLLPMRK